VIYANNLITIFTHLRRFVRLTARWSGPNAGQEGPSRSTEYFLGHYRDSLRWNP